MNGQLTIKANRKESNMGGRGSGGGRGGGGASAKTPNTNGMNKEE